MDNFSVTTAKIELFAQRSDHWQQCGIGTGFFYNAGDELHFVTNWHNVTGVDPITMQPLDPEDPLPTAMRVHCKRRLENPARYETFAHDIALYENQRPVWYEHRTRQNVDVVSLRFDRSRLGEDFGNLAINSVGQESRLAPYPGMDCFVLGFPEGMNGPGLTPIWKRGSIATEPLYDFRGTPGFLIDTATRKGMSGSPVLARHTGVFRPGGGEEPTPFDVIGTVFRFVGIYSGRLGNDPMEVQLGMVWRDGVLNDITSCATVGCNPFL